ncbi:MAG: DUF4390 domain-containing protein [Gemmatimonadales bacterium]|nr:MAG: DUF4390 domain-containing protein [Gemmatimonadales bacterium]
MARLALLLALFLAAAPVVAQERVPPLDLRMQEGDGSVRLILGEVLESPGVRQSLESGLPVRMGIVVELWRDRVLDALEGRHEWRATVLMDPLSNRYLVETGDGVSGDFASLAGARAFLQGRLQVPLAPERGGRFYYLARLEVETLSLSDLEELRRWLQGDLGPAVEGREEVRGAVGRGLRRLLVRALGLPVQRYQTRTATFDH